MDVIATGNTIARTFTDLHRTVEIGRELWQSASPAALFEAGSARAGCPGHRPVGFRAYLRVSTVKVFS